MQADTVGASKTTEQHPSVPVIDISGYFGGLPEAKREIAAALDRACRALGFVVVTGHNVPEELIDRVDRVSRAFFDLPESVKLRYAPPNPSVYRGYMALGGLAASYSLDDRASAPDYREMYVMSRERVDVNDPYFATENARRIFTPNIWPDAIPEFAPAWIEYSLAMEKLAKVILHLFALGLELPENWFDSVIDKHMSTLAVTNYPDQPNEPAPGQLRCGAHTDFGAITILKAEDMPGGLEVLTADGRWEAVPIVPESYIINIGDMMKRWTNDEWQSSFHRVANPPRDKALGSRRQSLICFFHPNYDTQIVPLPTCKGPPKYPPITAQEHLRSKIGKMQDVTPKPS